WPATGSAGHPRLPLKQLPRSVRGLQRWRYWLPWRRRIQAYRPPAVYERRMSGLFTVQLSGHLASYEAAFDTVQQHYWLMAKPVQAELVATSVGDGIQASPKAWSFSGDTWQTFDDHIRRSIPFYDQLHELIVGYACEFARHDGWLYELGCSTGNLSQRLSLACPTARVCGIDAEPAMVAKAQKVRRANLEYHCADIRAFSFTHSALKTDLVVLCYTLQFLPVNDRLPLLRRIHAALRPGGALVLAEKVKRQDKEFEDLCRRVHHHFKRQQGYTDAEIDAKDRSLEGVLVPLFEEENIGLLHQAGFRLVNSVFHNTAFEAWLAVK
ncbi:MAG: methyltransferase domain-containing protein, partial [Natronospirillum sp.]